MTYIFGGSGEKLVFFRDLGSKGKILLGSRGNYFQGSGEINALFSGIKGAQTPLGASSMPAQKYSCHHLEQRRRLIHVQRIVFSHKSICDNMKSRNKTLLSIETRIARKQITAI